MDINRRRLWMDNRNFPERRGLRPSFVAGVMEFLDVARNTEDYLRHGKIRCPCEICECVTIQDLENVELHLYKKGFMPNYYIWYNHGEPWDMQQQIQNLKNIHGARSSPVVEPDQAAGYRMEDMVNDAFGMYPANDPLQPDTSQPNIEHIPNAEAKKFYERLEETSRPFYEGSVHSQLSVAVRLMSIKSDFSISQAAMDSIIALMNELNPTNMALPTTYYYTKKLVSSLGLSAEKIHCCVNGCMLYYKDDADLQTCTFCEEPRYKPEPDPKKKPKPVKWMHYLPLIPRLKRLYASMSSAPHMRWHHDRTKVPGILSHPSDGEAWKHFDQVYPAFASEPRNVRLGLCSDGFTPFDVSSTPYSCWPVFVTPYNLPPEMCMTSPYLFLNCIIPGPHNPKASIDVYLQPLLDELQILWREGVETYDISTKQNFQMRASLMWTINDFPAYGMLSGWSTAGKLACPYCMEDTKAFTLKYGGKCTWFDCCRRFLPMDHPFRSNTSAFMKNQADFEEPPRRLSGIEIWDRVRELPKVTEQLSARAPGYGVEHNWTKQSIFWELPYWKDNLLRHNLDPMHIEKNFFEAILNTVMDVRGKTKDNLKARLDLQLLCRRPELQVIQEGNSMFMPKACYTFDEDERRMICEWVSNLRMPDGYASNLERCVDVNGGKLHHMKSHDCHIFMENLLPIAFNGLPDKVLKPLTETSLFFKELCSKTLKEENLNLLEQNFPVVATKLTKIFPPGFFNVMEHLPIHLAEEARLGGPVHCRWMYPFERIIGKCKRDVKNRNQIEGSICEAYLARETSHFCSYYFDKDVPCLRTRPDRHDMGDNNDPNYPAFSIFNQPGRGNTSSEVCQLNEQDRKVATTHVLLNCPEVTPYYNYFVAEFGDAEVYENFTNWFTEFVNNPVNGITFDFLRDICHGPYYKYKRMNTYFVNGYKFHTKQRSEGKKTYNSGVSVKVGTGDHGGDFEYYGVIEEMLEVEYSVGWPRKKLVLFRCKWFDPSKRGTRVDPSSKLVEVNHKRSYGHYDPFIIAQKVKQVWFVPYPRTKNPARSKAKAHWWAVIKGKPVGLVEVPDLLDVAYQNEVSTVPLIADNELADQLQHIDGIYEQLDASVASRGKNPVNFGEGASRANDDEYTDEEEVNDEDEEEELADDED